MRKTLTDMKVGIQKMEKYGAINKFHQIFWLIKSFHLNTEFNSHIIACNITCYFSAVYKQGVWIWHLIVFSLILGILTFWLKVSSQILTN